MASRTPDFESLNPLHTPSSSIYGLDLSGTITSIRCSSLNVIGNIKEDDILEKNIFEIFQCFEKEKYFTFKQALSKGEVCTLRFECKEKKGISTYQCQFIPYPEQNPLCSVLCIVYDITTLRQKSFMLEGSSYVLEKLASGEELSKLLDLITKTAEDANPEMLCSILLLDDQKSKLLHASAPSLPPFYNEAVNGISIGYGEGSCGTVAYTGRRVIVEDILSDPFWHKYKDLAQKAGVRACWSEPILSSLGEILGTFAMYFTCPRKPSSEDLDLIHTYAHLAGIAIEKKKTEQIVELQTLEQARMNRELDQANTKLRELVAIDTLTGLLNRRGFEQILETCISKAMRFKSDFKALMIDLDNFKFINDTLGYRVGDQVINKVGTIIKNSIRTYDYAARIGGDEFIVIIPEARKAEATLIAEKIRIGVARAMIGFLKGRSIGITASIGIVGLLDGIHSMDDLLEKASLALHKSKHAGKNMITYTNKQGAIKRKSASPLRKVIEDSYANPKSFKVFKQAIMKLQDQNRVGYELLSRFPGPQGYNPEEFFHRASEEGILTLADRTCLKNCLSFANHLDPHQRTHVNLFPSTLIETSIKELTQVIHPRTPHSSIVFEISEQQIIGNPEYLADATQRLKNHGFLISIDDVGFGSTCLESMLMLEPEIIKIDRKCIHEISQNKNKRHALKRLLKMVDTLDAEVIAEGIETVEDLNVLLELGVVYGQGFLFGKPSEGFPNLSRTTSSKIRAAG